MGNMIPEWLRAMIDPGAAAPGLDEAAPWLIAALLIGYLLGSIPFGVLVARAFGIGDLRQVGSGNIGATNVLRAGGKAAGALTLLLDGLKGAAAVWLAGRWGPDAAALGAAGAVLGHLFPVWLRFSGGKGVATLLGVTLALSWLAGALALVAWLAGAGATRRSSVGGLAAALACPLGLWATGRYEAVLATLALAALVWARHHANIARLLAGTEPKIGERPR
ncbi:MAG: glycerol-3-phosphate 1-O-acyltransferase PlsY [Pseudomonadota bacterium]